MGSSMSAAADRHTANALILFGSRSTTGPAAPVETATDEIRGQIVNGSWPVGSRIPPESALCETLGGSRAAIHRRPWMRPLASSPGMYGILPFRWTTDAGGPRAHCLPTPPTSLPRAAALLAHLRLR